MSSIVECEGYYTSKPGIQNLHIPIVLFTSGVLFGKPNRACPPQTKYILRSPFWPSSRCQRDRPGQAFVQQLAAPKELGHDRAEWQFQSLSNLSI
jgi:hypothetical protein